MATLADASRISRRGFLASAMTLAGVTIRPAPGATANAEGLDDDVARVAQAIGKPLIPSPRVRLTMPGTFPTGSTVPMTLTVDSAMTPTDHVRRISVYAPRNPFIEIAEFRLAIARSLPRIVTRVRLSEPQHVIAVAEMNNDALLLAAARVDVATDGCH